MDKQLQKIIEELWVLKYRNLRAYDTLESGVSKFLVVATAINVNENKKLANIFAQNMKYEQKIDGIHKGEWIIFDFEEVVVHLFASGHREKYNMDKLYKGREIVITRADKKAKIDTKKKNKV